MAGDWVSELMADQAWGIGGMRTKIESPLRVANHFQERVPTKHAR